ncbi:muscle M-line assembly protein unc-89-like [Rhopilema esculentum]|uniref:muscle M-line assembly protein unc-89-like n=1 Tax=Rhopilema esculentum TaxID=499914 RepID=UPI0031CDC4E0|eukprot:gene12445-3114_t
MPEKVEEQPVQSTDNQQEEAKEVPKAEESHEAGNENGAEKQDGAEVDKAETGKQEGEPGDAEAPKRRGRKPKKSGEGPETKKPRKEVKTPERVSSRVRNRSTGEKMPAFKDMKEELRSPTRRKSKSDAKDDEKPATSEGEQVEATA